jgi:hypothetical protein
MGKSNDSADAIVSDKGASHDSLMPLLAAMFREFQDASKKKADAVLNKRKVEIVNRLLVDVFKILDGEPNRNYVDLLDENDLPQNGDDRPSQLWRRSRKNTLDMIDIARSTDG